MRQVILDTETTGLSPEEGHRVIEIGCYELEQRRPTGQRFHEYLNPGRLVDPEAMAVHGLTDEFLSDKPRFSDVAQAFVDFVGGAELIIHNASFDVGFLDYELGRMGAAWGCVTDHCSVLDTLELARRRHPGQRNSLDALCRRYGIDNTRRELHGALLDAELLAEVYLAMTGGQAALLLGGAASGAVDAVVAPIQRFSEDRPRLATPQPSETALAEHAAWLDFLDEKLNAPCVWRALSEEKG
ncbi:MAG: DNA polymerase III subunit epsilon [Gammaproteobacteria bacterium]|nr:DNA polymerase III subunit epsilon [Gammaproteobacteria bacterium]